MTLKARLPSLSIENIRLDSLNQTQECTKPTSQAGNPGTSRDQGQLGSPAGDVGCAVIILDLPMEICART